MYRSTTYGVRKSSRRDKGAVLVAGIIIMAALLAIALASLRRASTGSRIVNDDKTLASDDSTRRSVVNMALLATKNYVWGSGHSLQDLLPTSGSRWKTWSAGAGTFNGIPYTVDVGDNWESAEGGSQNYYVDHDNKAYLRVSYTLNGKSHMTQVLMSPGNPASAGSGGTPLNIPGSVGVCYGAFNFITLVSMKSGTLTSGYDRLSPGEGSCPANPTTTDLANGGVCDGSHADQYGIASTSWLGTWNLGTVFDISSLQGVVEGKPQPNGVPSPSFGRPTSADCSTFDTVLTDVNNMVAANSPNVVKYQAPTFGTLNVNGNLVIGTQASPKVLVVKSGWFGTVNFTGSVSGWGVLLADGNATFSGPVNWNGVVINNANTIGNVLSFDDSARIIGAAEINRPILSAEIGSASLDIRFATNNAFLYYSYSAVDSVMSKLDPNYVPPVSSQPGQSVGVYSIQYVN